MSETIHVAQLLFSEDHPLSSVLNMTFYPVVNHTLRVDVDAPETFADCDDIHVHTGYNTLLLDTVLGSCAIGELKKAQPIATVKLSCNHIHKAKINEPLTCNAYFDGDENSISNVRGEIISRESNRVISHAVATFMIGTAAKPLEQKS